MSRFAAGLALLLSFAPAFVPAQEQIPPALAAMADAEREFARTARDKGWRDAFLEFFADDAIAFSPAVIKAKERISKQPSQPFSEIELIWEPRTGDVAASGDLGWLTGPSRITNYLKDKKANTGCYLSVWRKQPDGRWRVIIDIGADSPEPVPFAPGFTRIAFGDRYTGKDGKEASTRSLGEADRDLDAKIAAQGTARAYAERLTSASRLHRWGSVPTIGRDAIAKWLEANATASTAKPGAAESAASGDFGYSYGNYEVTAPKPNAGIYVRLWSRDAAGRWWVMVDITQTFKSTQP
jgi:ketosteroid isomerase-like protein